MSLLTSCTLAVWLLVSLVAALTQPHRRVAIAVTIIGGVFTLLSTSVVPQLGWPLPLVLALQLAMFAPFVRLRGRLRSPWFHALVVLPGSWWFAGIFLGFPWALASGFGYPLPWAWLPFAIAAVGLFDSLYAGEELVDLVLDGAHVGEQPRRHRSARPAAGAARPLRIVQITDPHLGPFMSVRRLRRICARAVARQPDLIVLTGDFLTFESNGDPDALARALAPLAAAAGRTFACLGNHDLEALDVVQAGLRSAGVRLLVDEAALVETAAGPVQLLGCDFRWRDRAAHLAALCASHPRYAGALRLVLLHDPGAFRHLPHGEADLVLSGHTHGGQVGLLRLGLRHTVLSALTKIPDHGLWARGRDRLYVHRGTGHYGFPLRIGVPTERSMLHVHRAPADSPVEV